MADFKYIINAELKLNTGSLKAVISQISEMDKSIKEHFGSKGGGVRVPVIADKDITGLQKSVSQAVEKYNKGQVPTIKIPIAPDESSIRKLQERISEIKKQINSLSDDKNNISINTSLKV
ncbi:MAG TPA: hypothetical protein VKU94_04590, partial [Geobacterales bacterium]|nr:hypothetical protein [Geobacterales bacterium]